MGDKTFHDIDIDYEILSMPESMRHIMQDALARAKVLDVMLKREAVAQKAKEMGLDRDPLISYRMHKADNSVLIQSIREWQNNEFEVHSDKKIEAYYKKHLSDFVVPEQVHARHILLSDKQKALEVLKLLKAEPESFPTLAAQYSIDDSNKGRGGDLNWFARGTMVKPFEKVVFAMNEKNRFSKPVKTEFGWHIIEWMGKRKSMTPSLEDTRVEIASILDKEKLSAWIASLMSEADIEIVNQDYRLQP
ncbi:MAG: peptidylprolyl isomerase [Ghiorsea sp.]